MPTKLGQNFLNSDEIVERIVKSADLSSNDIILEIGPGRGILTNTLRTKVKKVIGIEIDSSLYSFLTNKFENNSNIEIIEGDILKINIPELLKNRQIKNYKVIANIPYYITSKIIRLFLESEIPPKEMILMTQKEVAERITALPGKMSKLAISVQYYADPKILFMVDKKNFDPIPKVDSAVIKINNIKKILDNTDNKNFFKIVRAGFCARRKTLLNNLSNSLHLTKNEVIKILKENKLPPNIRAQELSLKKWKKISQILK